MVQYIAQKGSDPTEKEIRILQHVLEGKTNKEIGRILGVSFLTVKNHLRNIATRFDIEHGTETRIKSAYIALQRSLIIPPCPALSLCRVRYVPQLEALPDKFYSTEPTDWIRYKTLLVSPGYRTVRIHNQAVDVGGITLDLLLLLVAEVGRTMSRQYIMDKIWGKTVAYEERNVDVWIRRLRVLLTSHQSEVEVQTIPGYGYRLPIYESPSKGVYKNVR